MTPEEFQESINKLKVETGYDVWNRFLQVRGVTDTVKLQPNKRSSQDKQDRDSFTLKLVSQNQQFQEDSMDFNDTLKFCGLSQSTEKWNPLTFAVYNGNLDLVTYILSKSHGNTKRLMKIPGIFKT
jgi:hypothetical protein